MTRSSLFLALGTCIVLSAATAHAQQVPGPRQGSPAHKATPHQPVTSTAKRSSSTTKVSGVASTRAAAASTTSAAGASKNNPDTPNTVNANGSIGSQESADGKGQGAYAAPGAPINPASSQKTASYDGKAPKPASPSKGSSTLKPAGKP